MITSFEKPPSGLCRWVGRTEWTSVATVLPLPRRKFVPPSSSLEPQANPIAARSSGESRSRSSVIHFQTRKPRRSHSLNSSSRSDSSFPVQFEVAQELSKRLPFLVFAECSA